MRNVSVIALIFISLFLSGIINIKCSIQEVQPINETKESQEFDATKDILNKEEITKSEFKLIFKDMLKDLLNGPAKDMFENIIEKVAEKVPETFLKADLEKYLDVTMFMELLKDLMKGKKEEI